MIYISFPKTEVQDAPAVVADRLRSWWITPGVYLILDGVFLEILSGPEGERRQEEHFLVALDGSLEDIGKLSAILRDRGLPPSTLWEQSNVIQTVNQAAAFYLQEGSKETGGAIHQRLSEALPDNYAVLSNAGRYFLKAELLSEACGYLERAYELAPHVPEVAVNFMVLRQLENKQDEATAVFEKLVSEQPDHPLVRRLREQNNE